jgi:RNA polymerase sigma factor, sigma-70 family
MSVDFEKLYKSYYMEVYSYVMTVIKNAHLAEEITQEVFFKALKSKSSYCGESSEFTWLCAIAKNACMDELRKQSRFGDTPDEVVADVNVEKMLEDRQTTLHIHQMLHRMEEPYKEVFQLRIFGELSFKEIGAIFQKTESWGRVTYHRARLKIQERMKEYE